ncbi:MAG: 3-methyl-2-oxobutanoate dehydrogenase subunit VorB [Elusimicrobiota bacterium]|jgi:2-oxoglutarate ferredoxin oxidoreductase subunit alpha
MGERLLMKGNDALAEGAVRAGCRFFAGYPITPQNEVPEYMSWRMPEAGGAFVQAESEVAAINMLFGAAATGIRAMTSSSSPGVSLKQEGISYCAGADLPIFFANVMRGGPGLGNIAGAQGDYYQSVRGGGHGDYRTLVLAPNSAEEMGNLPLKCYELAEKYRIPAMILADGVLGQMMEPLEFKADAVDPAKLKVPDWALGVNKGRARRMVGSYDLRDGELEKMILARVQRYKEAEEKEALWETKNCEDAEVVMVAYGIASRACLAALKLAREQGLKVGLLRPITLWPFPKKPLIELSRRVKSFVAVELSLGQMIDDVKLSIDCRVPVHLHARPGGVIPTGEEIVESLKKALKAGAKQGVLCCK